MKYGIRSVRYTGAKSWNNMPFNIKQSPLVTSFCLGESGGLVLGLCAWLCLELAGRGHLRLFWNTTVAFWCLWVANLGLRLVLGFLHLLMGSLGHFIML